MSDPGNTVEIDVTDEDDLVRWSQRLGVSPNQLLVAVRLVGPRVFDIQQKLGLAIAGVRPT